jgi:hypothetical protein
MDRLNTAQILARQMFRWQSYGLLVANQLKIWMRLGYRLSNLPTIDLVRKTTACLHP